MSGERLYTTAVWRRLRRQVLERDGHRCYVAGCLARADTVDHIVPASESAQLQLAPSNLRASCGRHNFGRSPRRLAAMARVNRRPASTREW